MLVKTQVDAFSSAASLLMALSQREIGARELLEALIRRCERFDGVLNSIVVKDFERARRDATAADQRRRDADDPPLLGLPITIKESLDVEGLPSTAGVPFRKGHVAPKDSPTVARLRAAGAVIFGKTNVCTWLADFQSDNPIYGRTNNPWNLARTPGGSSGGSATLAAGLTTIDIGTDLAGSIRVPAAFCGIWGHKPSESVVPNSGHFPGSPLPNPLALLAVQGPHARSATDLELSLNLMAGPDVGSDKAWSLNLPPARHNSIADFRVAILPAQPWLPVDPEILEAQERLIHELTSAGAAVKELSPPGFEDLRAHYALFRSMMSALVSVHWPDDLRQTSIANKLARSEEFHTADARGFAATAPDLFRWHAQREIYRAAWRDFFKNVDILITPITLTPAFEHTTVPNADRRLLVNGSPVEFEYMSFYPSLASMAGQPATVIPAGLTESGLPIGLQIIGPCLEDRTTLKFAQLLESLTGSFSPPPGYSGDL